MILDADIVLALNSLWQPIGEKNVRKAINDIVGESHVALNIDYEVIGADESGNPVYDFSKPTSIVPCTWKEWETLPVRPFDAAVHMLKKSPESKEVNTIQSIRVPTVIIAKSFAKMPRKYFKATNSAIRERDKDTCQYTGRKLKKGEGNIDHVIPRDVWKKMGLKGNPNSWENMVYCDKELNSQKGNRLNSELGLALIRKPSAPLPAPASALIKRVKHRDWHHFLYENK